MYSSGTLGGTCSIPKTTDTLVMLCVAQAELFEEDNKSASKMLHLRFTISELVRLLLPNVRRLQLPQVTLLMRLLHSLLSRGQRRHLQPDRSSPVLHLVVRVALKFGCIVTPKGMLQENLI